MNCFVDTLAGRLTVPLLEEQDAAHVMRAGEKARDTAKKQR